MALKELKFIALHGPLFMQGSNLGEKISSGHKGARIFHDAEAQTFGVLMGGKYTGIGNSNVASYDFVEVPDEIQKLLKDENPGETLPPVLARARRGRPPLTNPETPIFDPNDEDAHRAAVRAASAQANKPTQTAFQEDALLQASRNAAAGVKTAQVTNPTKPAEGATVTGKPKAINHTQLKAQIAKEAKEVMPQ